MTSIAPLKTAAQVKADFLTKGVSIRQWSLKNGFTPSLVYEILANNSKRRCSHGQSHKIAVSLGMKKGEIVKCVRNAMKGSQ